MLGHELCTITSLANSLFRTPCFFERLMCYSRNFPIRGWLVSKPRNLFQSPNATANPRRQLLGSPLGREGEDQSTQAQRDNHGDEEDADLERRD